MSLKKKIALSFFISAFLIALLAAFEYVNFTRIKNEIRFLELTDTLRSKSLQLRRHEKNFFLYGPFKAEDESREIHRYLDELDELLAARFPGNRAEGLFALKERMGDYRRGFDAIERLLMSLLKELERAKALHQENARFFPLIEAAVYERPAQAAEFLRNVFRYSGSHVLTAGLNELDGEINALRKSGEDIIVISKDLDKRAREKVETDIRISQAAILIVFPVFLVTGVILLFLTTRNIVRRLQLLMDVMEKSGKGALAHVKAPVKTWGNDEVGLLIRKFDDMEDALEERQAELEEKNRELLQSKKLAAIGTLAAGVAHELNNPLNNIYLSTQVLAREAGADCPPAVREVVSDILGQTVRVKKIVGDLLEFARGREPQKRETELGGLIRGAFNRLRPNAERIAFSLDSDSDVILRVDPEQMEQVFINLFTNAVEAMSGRGELKTTVIPAVHAVKIRISDTGKGMPKEAIEKIFEPFFTTKQKGTGLGLAIVFNIIKKHGGDIAVESEEGKGTTFTITLPKEQKFNSHG
jgi:signal transduction histidine kinase